MKQTRERILQVALELFNEKGFANVTMREIASNAGVAVGNVTYYFHQKTDMIPDLISPPEYLSFEPAGTLTDFFHLIDAMLEALLKNRFFFCSGDLINYDEHFRADYSLMQEEILEHLKKNLLKLINNNILCSMTDDELKSVTRFMLSRHIVWITGILAPSQDDPLNKTNELLLHVGFMNHLITDDYKEELNSIEEDLKNGRFL